MMRSGLWLSAGCLGYVTTAIQATALYPDTVYWGVSVGAQHLKGRTQGVYGNDAGSPIEGWSNGEFHGDVYNTIASLTAEDEGPAFLPSVNENSTLSSFGGNIFPHRDRDFPIQASVLLGHQFQKHAFFYAGETRLTFGQFGQKLTRSVLHTDTKSGAFSDSEGAQVSFTNYGSVLTGATSPVLGFDSMAYNVNYTQNYTEEHRVQWHVQAAAIGLWGCKTPRADYYTLLGLQTAPVTLWTNTTVIESATGTLTEDGSSDTAISATQRYDFSDHRTQWRLAPIIGVGSRYKLQKHAEWSVEAAYYDAGKIRVRGRSQESTATYTAQHRLRGFHVQTGIIWLWH